MIHKAKVGSNENVTIVSFGDGTVSFSAGYTPDLSRKFLLFKKDSKGVPGIYKTGSERTIEDFNPDIIFEFKNKESFDYFIDFLTIAKSIFIQEKIKQ
ncbi:hypothetical protein HZP25_11685 [Elizabethkingia anophelis]|nr:hypothetical protein [Elizabethkingia anophelis]